MNIITLTAQNCSLFEIDTELEAAFDQMQEEREITDLPSSPVFGAYWTQIGPTFPHSRDQ